MRRKGTTIIEMVLVLAITAIISVMVVSFSIAANTWIDLGTDRLHLLEEEKLVNAYVETFLETYDRADYKFSSNGSTLTAIGTETDDARFTLKFAADDNEEDDITGELSYNIFLFEDFEKDGENPDKVGDPDFNIGSSYNCEYVEAVSFKVIEKSGKQLVICRFFYNLGEEYEDRSLATGSFMKVYSTVIPKKAGSGT